MFEGIIAIQSNAIALKDGKVMMNKNEDGSLSLPGRAVFENENPEEVCLKRLQEGAKIIKPLSPKISWENIGSLNFPVVSLNYLTEADYV